MGSKAPSGYLLPTRLPLGSNPPLPSLSLPYTLTHKPRPTESNASPPLPSARCASGGREEPRGKPEPRLSAAASIFLPLSEGVAAAAHFSRLSCGVKSSCCSGWKMASCCCRRRRLYWLLVSLLGSLGYYKTYGITVYSDNERVTAREFEGVSLSCKHNVKKEVGPRVEWKKIKGSTVSFVYLRGVFVGSFKDRAEILQSSIHLKNVTRKDSGKYRCEISAPTEQGQGTGEVEISLLVLVPPSAPVCEVPISALSGTVVELRCKESEGVPASKYRWYRNGAIVPENTFFWRFKREKISYTLNTTTGTLLFNPVSKNDTGEYYCEAYNRVGRPQRCQVKRMQVDDLNVSAIIASVVIVALIMACCGLGVYYAQKKGYFSKRNSSMNQSSKYRTTASEKDFKHTKSFII